MVSSVCCRCDGWSVSGLQGLATSATAYVVHLFVLLRFATASHVHVQSCVDHLLVARSTYLTSGGCPQPCWCPHGELGSVRCDALNLTSVPPTLWNDWPTSVNLSANRLTVWPPISPADTSDITLSGGVACVRTLLLIGNGLVHIRPVTLAHMRELQHLAVDNNLIEKLDADTFVGLADLELLDLSRNRIGVLPESIFRDLIELKVNFYAPKAIICSFGSFEH